LEITTPAATVAVKARKVKEGKSQSFTLTRTENLGVSETVSYATKNGSAKGGKDYKAAAGIVTFGVGEGSKKVKVKTKNDGRDERNERFFLTVTAGGVTSRGAARIKDND
ncbi:MAG: Calx-beta domain-containing protein, partial [Actinomycetota bacterium]